MRVELIVVSVFLFCGFAYADKVEVTHETLGSDKKAMSNPSWQYPEWVDFRSAILPIQPRSKINPGVPIIPPVTPCFVTDSCAPGIGLESGAETRRQDQSQQSENGVRK